MFVFNANRPKDPLEKVEKIIEMAFAKPRLLRHRDIMGKNQENTEE